MIPAKPFFDLTDRVAVVSGAAQGLGRAMAYALADAGADLLLLDRNAAGMRATAEHIAPLGRRAVPVTCDVSEPEQVRGVYREAAANFPAPANFRRRTISRNYCAKGYASSMKTPNFVLTFGGATKGMFPRTR